MSYSLSSLDLIRIRQVAQYAFVFIKLVFGLTAIRNKFQSNCIGSLMHLLLPIACWVVFRIRADANLISFGADRSVLDLAIVSRKNLSSWFLGPGRVGIGPDQIN